MSQQVFNSSENISISSGVSAWFQRDYAGDYVELGDLIAAGISLAPEFVEHYSYRNGLRGLRKKLLTKRAATVNMTLHEPNIYTLQRAVFGGTITSNVDSITAEESRVIALETYNSTHLAVDFSNSGETAYADITVTAVYQLTDVLYSDNLITGTKTVDVNGICDLGVATVLGQSAATTGPSAGDEVLVRYTVNYDDMYSTQIFGATDSTIEGAAKIQVRNLSGGVVQLWFFSSVQLSANGDIGYPLDSVQTVPMTMDLLERNGSFGTLYAA